MTRPTTSAGARRWAPRPPRPPVTTPPGLPALRLPRRHPGAFAASMPARLTRSPALERFTSREPSDPTIALVDAWSSVLDVLAFYTERLADESYLRTATEPRSLGELAHAVGYRPGRGRASATVLALTLEDAVGAPTVVPVPVGTRVASLPGPGELPQTYETTAALTARPAWNAIRRWGAFPSASGRRHLAVRRGPALRPRRRRRGPPGRREREARGADAHWAIRPAQLGRTDARARRDAGRVGRPPRRPGRLVGTPASSEGTRGRDLRLFVLRPGRAVSALPHWRLDQRVVGGGQPDDTTGAPSLRARSLVAATGQAAHAGGRRYRDTVESRHTGPDWPDFSVVAPGQPENPSTSTRRIPPPPRVPGSCSRATGSPPLPRAGHDRGLADGLHPQREGEPAVPRRADRQPPLRRPRPRDHGVRGLRARAARHGTRAAARAG